MTWQAVAGAQSKDLGRQALAFLPNELWVQVGDSITWTFATDEVHTVTFLKQHNPQQTRPANTSGVSRGLSARRENRRPSHLMVQLRKLRQTDERKLYRIVSVGRQLSNWSAWSMQT